MAGVALLLDLLKRNNPSSGLTAKSLHPCGLLSATVAATVAAAAGTSFSSRRLFGDGDISIAFCDAGAEWREDYIPSAVESASGEDPLEDTFYYDSIKFSTKEYPIELKPLFSAFGLKSLAITSLRSFFLFYLPLLEPRSLVEEDDDLVQDFPEESIDLVGPFKKSLKQIARETTVVTTRRVLERLATHYVSRRMVWKLLKDVPRSAMRKSRRGMPTIIFFYSVCRTTFNGHLLGVTASWLAQVGIHIYRCLFCRPNDKIEEVTTSEKIQLLGKRIYGTTIRCSASLIFASLGAGIGVLFHPFFGQWIGCALGDVGGPIIVTICFGRYLHLDT
uniref:Uncharacterized protein YDR514C n=1 Tax=Anthurium amnicola TaxID=1678845 RepID=A0A1D1Y7C8_9ARAE